MSILSEIIMIIAIIREGGGGTDSLHTFIPNAFYH